MLGATYNVYRHPATDTYTVRTMGYSLPSALHPHVSVITPTTYFGGIHAMKSTSFIKPAVSAEDLAAALVKPEVVGGLAAVPTSCNTVITPACLRALYNTTSYVPAATATNKLGIVGYLEEFANFADLQVLAIIPTSRFVDLLIGGCSPCVDIFQTVQD